ncbi:hypothetical protein CIG2463D_1493 [Campylobacter iguaniorum]|uniref:hypothetical protein n=1 Tax=Campylobacter iguaniorum TaxID=1244531 RepID=UPI00073A02E0|nr:hypothetical protein [Campylobacter iguaniorum]ALV25058.1 hypothetical protein CIG2463D_1493 [Campylobacter iguaniorum]
MKTAGVEISEDEFIEEIRKDLDSLIQIIEKYPRYMGYQTKLLRSLNAYFNYDLQSECEKSIA